MAVRKVLPEHPVASAAARAAGMMAIPGWVSMRNVSHLPPAKIISALTKAAPALVNFSPLHSTVKRPALPDSSSRMIAKAWRVAGMSRATNAELNACNVTPLARSITAEGRSSNLRLATKSEKSRLSDMGTSFRRVIAAAWVAAPPPDGDPIHTNQHSTGKNPKAAVGFPPAHHRGTVVRGATL